VKSFSESPRLGWDGDMGLGLDYGMKTTLLADRVGFDSVWFSDHFFSWHHVPEAHIFFTWPVMAVAAERTKKIAIGVGVTSPIGGRYHPAIVAQACATLGGMYPGRILLGVGSGEAINEAHFMKWPKWRERMDRLVEGLDLIRKLWSSSDYFRFDGKYFKMERAFLYEKPRAPIPIYFAASGEKSAYYAGKYGDHVLLLPKDFKSSTPEYCRDALLPKFKEGAREAEKDIAKLEKAVLLLGGIGDLDSMIARIKRAEAGTWSSIDDPDPKRILEKGLRMSDDTIRARYIVASKPDELIEHFEEWINVGFNHIIFGDCGSQDPLSTLKAFKRTVIPYFKGL